jgi:SAM-dependent methyltransferase
VARVPCGAVTNRRVELPPDRYDERWAALAASGHEVHGEVDLVEALLAEQVAVGDAAGDPARVLDAGCGTGRVAVELARRGFATVGVDVDRTLLDAARTKAPELAWIEADLATIDAGVAPGPFAAAVAAGNVMIFVAPGTETAVVANLAARLAPGGLLVAGFQLARGRLTIADYDAAAAAAGLEPVAHWSTWDRAPLPDRSDYVVAVHRRPAGQPSD